MVTSIAIIISRVIIILLMIAVPLAILAGLILLQIYLSKNESKWPGLILPIITFGMSMITILGIATFGITNTMTTTLYHDSVMHLEAISEREAIVEQHITGREPLPGPEITHHLTDYGTIRTVPVALSASILAIFILFNIPTAILLIIYAICRGNCGKLAALDMMSLQDL